MPELNLFYKYLTFYKQNPYKGTIDYTRIEICFNVLH